MSATTRYEDRTDAEVFDAIRRAKNMGPRLTILGHHYQRDGDQFADYRGDSWGSRQAAATDADMSFAASRSWPRRRPSFARRSRW